MGDLIVVGKKYDFRWMAGRFDRPQNHPVMMTFLTCFAVLRPGSPEQASGTRWMKMTLGKSAIGYYSRSYSQNADGSSSTGEEMKMVFNRLESKVTIATRSTFREDSAGKLVSVSSDTQSSGASVHLDAALASGEVTIKTRSGGREYSSTISTPEEVVSPRQLELRALRISRVGDSVSGNVFVTWVGKPAKETLTLRGMHGEQRTFDDVYAGIPGTQTVVIDSGDVTISRQQDSPFGPVLMSQSTEIEAKAGLNGGSLPKEMFDSTLIRSNIRLGDPRSVDRIRLLLETTRPELGWPDFESETQHVLSKRGNQLILEVRRPTVDGGALRGQPAGDEYLKANALIQSDDASVRRVEGGLKKGTPFSAARAAQDWVAAHAELDLGVVEAPASETIRTHKGTCYAFAILLASLERAAGVPSRVTMGFVYEQGIWGGHAWTEIFVGGHWVPLDAAMYSPGPADAARFRYGVSSLAAGSSELTSGGLQLFGNLKVSVLEYQIHGRTIKVGEHAAPYSVAGGTYRNPWLGFSVTCPGGAHFLSLGATYPDATVVSVKDARGGVVRIGMHSYGPSAAQGGLPGAAEKGCRVGGEWASLSLGKGEATATLIRGRAVWTISATGRDSRSLLNKVAKNIRFF